MKVFIPTTNRFLRPRNTDWRYAACALPSISKHCPDLNVATQDNLLVDATVNFRYGLSMLRTRGIRFLPEVWGYSLDQDCPIYHGDLRRTDAQAILSYERYPDNAFGLPVAWITSPSYPDILERQGMNPSAIERTLKWKRSRSQRAARLIFTTQVSLENFAAQNSDSVRSRSVVIPFLIPGLAPADDIESKWRESAWRLLFVGREANRKGLPAVLTAVLPLLKDNANVSLTIVSAMNDGPVDIPDHPQITVLKETRRSEVMALMRSSHILMMPSWFENYGFVYIEAMSQGCVPLALDRPVQRELLGDNAILVSTQDPDEIGAAIKDALANRDKYREKARRGLERFKAKHDSAVIASQFRDVFRSLTL